MVATYLRKRERTFKCNRTCNQIASHDRERETKRTPSKQLPPLSNTPSPVPESCTWTAVGGPCAGQQPWQAAGSWWGSHVSLWRSIHYFATLLSSSPFCWTWGGWRQEWVTCQDLTWVEPFASSSACLTWVEVITFNILKIFCDYIKCFIDFLIVTWMKTIMK